jgi:radical SAM protein with 4Fe4S-binding SPASM domain
MDTTNICNLRCGMCPMLLSDVDPDRNWHHIDPELYRKIEEQVFPLAATVGLSCGAEPFCNPDFCHFLGRLYRADVPVREVVTNGTLFDDDIVTCLVRTPPTTLFVSVDGASHDTHAAIRGGADLEATMGNLRLLQRRKGGTKFPMISFSTTLQRRNWRELPGIVELAADIGAVSVGVVPLVPYAGLDRSGEVVDPGEEQVAAAVSLAEETARRLGIRLVMSEGPDGTATGACGYIEDWVYIDPDGRVNPCPHWNTSEPLGDLTVQSFGEILHGEAYTALRDRLSRGELTGNCSVCPEMTGAVQGEPRKV